MPVLLCCSWTAVSATYLHYSHYLRRDHLSQAIPYLRIWGTLEDNLKVNQSLVQEAQRLSGVCTRHLLENKAQGRSNSYSLPLAILQLSCQLSSQEHIQRTGEQEIDNYRKIYSFGSIQCYFALGPTLAVSKNDIKWIRPESSVGRIYQRYIPTNWCAATSKVFLECFSLTLVIYGGLQVSDREQLGMLLIFITNL